MKVVKRPGGTSARWPISARLTHRNAQSGDVSHPLRDKRLTWRGLGVFDISSCTVRDRGLRFNTIESIGQEVVMARIETQFEEFRRGLVHGGDWALIVGCAQPTIRP
ncbi:hypothetical protein GCM10009606_23130 [Nocardioides aquiterrae]|uniref:Uncharacterized protein n=1 Tax=Nocardioides aquiterrae TaxID=203799 RepID=A0ABP4EXD3_9ACTN